MTELILDNLKLGDKVYESDPWQETVRERTVTQIAEISEKEKYSAIVKTWRRVRVDGGMLGMGEQIEKSEVNTKYFATREDARQNCVRRAIEMRKEHKRQLEKEAERLAEELRSLK